MGDTYLSDKNGERINPANEGLQRDNLTALNELLEGVGGSATNYGTEYLLVQPVSQLAEGPDQGCKVAHIMTDSDGVHLLITDDADEDADVEDFLLPQKGEVVLPVANLNKLKFCGATGGEKVYILWRA